MAALGEDLLGVVNKLQDLVFNTIGNDSLDLPQIVWHKHAIAHVLVSDYKTGRRWFPIIRKVIRTGKHCRQGLSTSWKRNCDETTVDPSAHQHPKQQRR